MHVSETQLKIIAIGLVPVFLILTFAMPQTVYKEILLGAVMLIGVVIIFIGMSMQKKQEAKEQDDLLAIPPKKS